MKPGSPLRSSWRRLGAEDGQALILAMAIVVVGMLLALGGAAYALSASSQSNHDQQRRAAQQAADAGVQQQLYLQAEANAIGYNASSGNLGAYLACVESNVGLSVGANAATQLIQVALGSTGVCPTPSCTAGSANCASGGPTTWSSLDNGDYYDTEYCPNPEYQSASGSPTAACTRPATATTSSSLAVDFPEILSVGCHSAAATCDTASSTNQYAKQLALISPTAPLQAVEGENNVTIGDSSSTSCSLISIAHLCVGSVITTALASTIVDGNILAGNALQVPSSTINLSSTSAGTLIANVVSGLLGILSSYSTITAGLQQDLGQNPGQQPVSLSPTYEYGNCYGSSVTPASGVSSPAANYACSGQSSVALNGNLVDTGLNNACSAGNLSTKCTLTRPSFSLGPASTPTPFATVNAAMSGASLGTCASATSLSLASGGAGDCYVNGDLSLTSGTLDLGAGTYVFCNVYVGPNATLEGPGSQGAVQIYLLAPGSGACHANATGANDVEAASCTAATSTASSFTPADTEGNFVVLGGVSDLLGGVLDPLVNGLTSTVDPSNFQIYVSGDGADSLTVNTNCQPRTSVVIGGTGVDATQALVIYAPRSNVSVSTDLAFEGAVIGWNVNMIALAIVQDLDLGNWPLSSVIASEQDAENESCSAASPVLTATSSDLSGC